MNRKEKQYSISMRVAYKFSDFNEPHVARDKIIECFCSLSPISKMRMLRLLQEIAEEDIAELSDREINLEARIRTALKLAKKYSKPTFETVMNVLQDDEEENNDRP